MKTKIAIACDDLGFDRKNEVIEYLVNEKMQRLFMILLRKKKME